ERLRELQEALARLDPEATRQALQRLADAQQELRRELERSEELFKRAALEGELASLAKDAEDLQRRQTEWTKEDAHHPDSAPAASRKSPSRCAMEKRAPRRARARPPSKRGPTRSSRRSARRRDGMRSSPRSSRPPWGTRRIR